MAIITANKHMIKPYYSNALTTLYNCDYRDLDLSQIPSDSVCITDPPYGIDLQNHGGNHKDRPLKSYYVRGDATGEVTLQFLKVWDSKPLIMFSSPKNPWPGKWRQYLVWNKGAAVGGGGDVSKCWHMSWELIQVRNTPKLKPPRQSAILDFPISPHNYKLHPSKKPVELMLYLIDKLQGQFVVFDPFCGVGSTLQAAYKLGIPSIGIEINKRYCDIAISELERIR